MQPHPHADLPPGKKLLVHREQLDLALKPMWKFTRIFVKCSIWNCPLDVTFLSNFKNSAENVDSVNTTYPVLHNTEDKITNLYILATNVQLIKTLFCFSRKWFHSYLTKGFAIDPHTLASKSLYLLRRYVVSAMQVSLQTLIFARFSNTWNVSTRVCEVIPNKSHANASTVHRCVPHWQTHERTVRRNRHSYRFSQIVLRQKLNGHENSQNVSKGHYNSRQWNYLTLVHRIVNKENDVSDGGDNTCKTS